MAVAPPTRRIERGRSERLAAWLYTGPLGRLYSAVVDIATLWAEWLWAISLERVRALRSGSSPGRASPRSDT